MLFDCGCFGEDEGRASYSPAAEVNQMPVVGKTVFAGILAHGRDGDPVAKCDAADLEWGEEVHGNRIKCRPLRRTIDIMMPKAITSICAHHPLAG